MPTETKTIFNRTKALAKSGEPLLRPKAPHNTTQYLSHNYNCRLRRRDLSLGEHPCSSFRLSLFLNDFRAASIPALPLTVEEKEKTKTQDPTNIFTAESQQSTTTGETSSDEDLHSSRL